jgi:uncharacterized protein YcnI
MVVGCALALSASNAAAHVSLGEVGLAGQRQVLDFRVGHGCSGADTLRVEVRLPPEITSVRAMPWAFGAAEVVTDAGGVPTAVIWSKTTVRPQDDQYYAMAIRITVPDAPFTTLYFPTIQTCQAADGTESVVGWVGLPGDPEDPAPKLNILPARYPGWNKLVAAEGITDLSLFNDAEIVWQGNAAYSSNPSIMDLIMTTPDVGVLSEISASTDIWVKY